MVTWCFTRAPSAAAPLARQRLMTQGLPYFGNIAQVSSSDYSLHTSWAKYMSTVEGSNAYSWRRKEDHSNLVGLSGRLFAQNPDLYIHFKPPIVTHNLNIKIAGAADSFIEDWSDVHETAITFGSPELVDQTSGAVYMRVAVQEDKCSKAYRVSDQVFGLSLEDLCRCLELSSNWPYESVKDSDTLQTIICNLDKACSSQINGNMKRNVTLRAAFLVCLQKVLKQPSLMLTHVMNQGALWLEESNPISYLLFAAFHDKPAKNDSEQVPIELLAEKVLKKFDDLSLSELTVAYIGLQSLAGEHNLVRLTELSQRIESRHGLRLNKLEL